MATSPKRDDSDDDMRAILIEAGIALAVFAIAVVGLVVLAFVVL